MTFHCWLVESVLFTPYPKNASIGSQEPIDLKDFLTGGLKFHGEPQHKSIFFLTPLNPAVSILTDHEMQLLGYKEKIQLLKRILRKAHYNLKVVNQVLSWACILVPCINEQFNVFTVSPPSLLPEIFASFSYNMLKSSTQTHHKSFQMTHFQYSPKLFVHMFIERIQV